MPSVIPGAYVPSWKITGLLFGLRNSHQRIPATSPLGPTPASTDWLVSNDSKPPILRYANLNSGRWRYERISNLLVVPGCGIQARPPAQGVKLVLNGAVGRVFDRLKVEFPGVAKSTWN